MSPAPRLHGKPKDRILCRKTGKIVGYLYQWNNGDITPFWIEDATPNVTYEPIAVGVS